MERIFQSTRPIRGATQVRVDLPWVNVISIHAPHTGRDIIFAVQGAEESIFQSTRPIRGATAGRPDRYQDGGDFNPRAPYGARPQRGVAAAQFYGISIHAPHTGRDRHDPVLPAGQRQISIHAPHTGRDFIVRSQITGKLNFNPRAPYGARPLQV